VVRQYGGRVRFVVENYGASELATRFGVTRYPAIFIDDILIATPKDFGFYGKGEGPDGGRYAPWRDAASHERFRADLGRMLNQILEGKRDALRTERSTVAHAARELSPAVMPPFTIPSLDGGTLRSSAFAGKPVLVEFWSTWCPPCRGTLTWLGELDRRYRGRIEVVALAIDSDPEEVRRVAADLHLPIHWAMASPALAVEFGDLSAVPTLFLFDAKGETREIFYGAPPDLHARAERALEGLLP